MSTSSFKPTSDNLLQIDNYAALRAAAVCCAGPKDPRQNLTGIYFELALGRLAGCDGHRVFRAVATRTKPGGLSVLWRPSSPMPKTNKHLSATLNLATGVLQVGAKLVLGEFLIPGTTDGVGKYPELDRVIPTIKQSGVGDLSFGVDTRLLVEVQNVFNASGVALHQVESDMIYRVTLIEGDNIPDIYDFCVMPMRF